LGVRLRHRKGTSVNKKYQKNAPKTSTGPGLAVPDAVTIAMGEIAEDMRALAVGAGLQVLGSLMEADVAAVWCVPDRDESLRHERTVGRRASRESAQRYGYLLWAGHDGSQRLLLLGNFAVNF
jgi:hypothetical protein